MTPFKDRGHLLRKQRAHNAALSRARVIMENTFGLLKGRWSILNYVNTYSVKKAATIIVACCILHNICLLNLDFFEPHEIYDGPRNQEYLEERGERNGIEKRSAICNTF
ncbi:hypothetical protein MML48_10g00004286 [Holotrichia oblita]|uniref:Uncharacterized protein n=1 Tax=Holotrichia oblita TaxID=644536 RepID=A0ACB9SG98_HOLOL|nr:hypothetical protein MML48_10g00004286 [Holotrichia oblita]